MKIQTLLHDWLLVEMQPFPEQIGSIILTEKSAEGQLRIGKVVQVGPGTAYASGNFVPVTVSVGDMVVFHPWNLGHKQGRALGHALEEMGSNYGLIRERDVLMYYPPTEEHKFW